MKSWNFSLDEFALMISEEVYVLLMAEILRQLSLVDYRIIYKVLYIAGGCLGFLP